MTDETPKEYFQDAIHKKPLLCAVLFFPQPGPAVPTKLMLPTGHSKMDLAHFLTELEKQSFGRFSLSGTIWFSDDSYSTFEETDSDSFWEHHKRPEIPSYLNRNNPTPSKE